MAGQKEVNVLLVEDTVEHAVLIRRSLESGNLGARLFWAADGKSALDFLYKRGNYTDKEANPKPDIILLDLRLPKIHGLKVLEQIKEDENLKDIPVAILTSSDEAKDIVGSYQTGAESFITKSVAFLNKGEGSKTILNTILSLAGVSGKEVTSHGK